MFLKRQDPHTLAVSMTGVKMGDQIVQVGCAHGGRLAAVAGKVGLSGRAVVVAPDESSAARARKGAADAGVLVEIEVAPPARLPIESDGFGSDRDARSSVSLKALPSDRNGPIKRDELPTSAASIRMSEEVLG